MSIFCSCFRLRGYWLVYCLVLIYVGLWGSGTLGTKALPPYTINTYSRLSNKISGRIILHPSIHPLWACISPEERRRFKSTLRRLWPIHLRLPPSSVSRGCPWHIVLLEAMCRSPSSVPLFACVFWSLICSLCSGGKSWLIIESVGDVDYCLVWLLPSYLGCLSRANHLFFLHTLHPQKSASMFQRKVTHPPEEEKEEERMMDEEALEEEDVVGDFPPSPPQSQTLTKRSRLSVVSKGFDSGNKVRCLYLSVLSCTYNNSLCY